MLTELILAVFGIFWALEAVAHFTHYRYGKTMSAWIWTLEARWPKTVRLLIAALLLILFTHLEFRTP